MSYGRYLEDLEVGRHFQHPLGRTITEFDDTLFSLMAMNQHPLHIDGHYASGTQHSRRLVVGPLVISIVIGLAQSDVGGRSLRVLEYADVQHIGPVFHGDTLYAESTVIASQQNDSRTGTVTVELRGLNQKSETVLTMQCTFSVPCRSGLEQAS